MTFGIVVAILLAVVVPGLLAARGAARERAVENAERQAAAVIAVLAITHDREAIDLALSSVDATWTGQVTVHGLNEDPIGTSQARTNDIAAAAGKPTATVVPVDGGLAYLASVDAGDGQVAVVEVFIPAAELTRGLGAAWTVAIIGLLLMVVSAVVVDRIADRAARSARVLASAARSLGDGDLEVRVPVEGTREIAVAAATFNLMADRVSTQLTAERELIADRSHRLRTPLTALRLEAERLGAGGGALRLTQAVEAMEREVDHVIHTARRSAEVRPLDPDEHCDAAAVVRERMNFWAAVAEDQSRPFAVFGTALRAPVPLPRSELAAAVDALLGNVFRYTPQGTPFEVEVRRHDGYVAIRVDDAGSGIPDPQSALRRGSSARGSTGLGLDIVRNAAIAGRGGVHIDRAALGGASVVVLLADAQAPPPIPRQRLGFVGRLSREPDERRWGRRARAARATGSAKPTAMRKITNTSQAYLMSFLSLGARLSRRWRRG